jgi:NADH dehydrogenase (ubiquinone) 1 alpha subcomplex subunit 8
MTLTDDIELPTEEEIAHKEIPLTYNYMIASAMWLGKYCDNQSKEFMLCRTEEGDPRKCLDYGRQVTECGLEFFKKVKKTCREELEWYNKCLDWTGKEPCFRMCRQEQALFDGCMAENGFERAKFGHFQMLRVHDSDRPQPKPAVPIFTDAVEPNPIFTPKRDPSRA